MPIISQFYGIIIKMYLKEEKEIRECGEYFKIQQSYEKMEPLAEPLDNKALNLYYEYMCVGGMPIAIKEYIEKEKNIIKFNKENKKFKLLYTKI